MLGSASESQVLEYVNGTSSIRTHESHGFEPSPRPSPGRVRAPPHCHPLAFV